MTQHLVGMNKRQAYASVNWPGVVFDLETRLTMPAEAFLVGMTSKGAWHVGLRKQISMLNRSAVSEKTDIVSLEGWDGISEIMSRSNDLSYRRLSTPAPEG